MTNKFPDLISMGSGEAASVIDVIKRAKVTSGQPSCEKHDELGRWEQLNIS